MKSSAVTMRRLKSLPTCSRRKLHTTCFEKTERLSLKELPRTHQRQEKAKSIGNIRSRIGKRIKLNVLIDPTKHKESKDEMDSVNFMKTIKNNKALFTKLKDTIIKVKKRKISKHSSSVEVDSEKNSSNKNALRKQSNGCKTIKLNFKRVFAKSRRNSNRIYEKSIWLQNDLQNFRAKFDRYLGLQKDSWNLAEQQVTLALSSSKSSQIKMARDFAKTLACRSTIDTSLYQYKVTRNMFEEMMRESIELDKLDL